jgi:lysophospholipase L1-like esterase
MDGFTFLSLGDSYTIGEQVAAAENFPSQTVKLLREAGYTFHDPEIVAKTGWTTDELLQAIENHSFKSSYDFVTLLIGVNNQYRGRTVENYKPEFEALLNQAIQFANGKAGHVIVLSIPDWGVTPFALDRDREKIRKEIDEYNSANKKIAAAHGVQYIDITPFTREAVNDNSLLAMDGLHPSGKEYSRWAEKIVHVVEEVKVH